MTRASNCLCPTSLRAESLMSFAEMRRVNWNISLSSDIPDPIADSILNASQLQLGLI